jgi:hypothetical protein
MLAPSLWQEILTAGRADAFLVVATVIFACAVVHALCASTIAHAVKHRGPVMHLLGEVEAVFGIWALILIATFLLWPEKGWTWAVHYLVTGNYNLNAEVAPTNKFLEPIFVFVVMLMASTKPVLLAAKKLLGAVADWFGGSTMARWWVILTLAPLLGSLITEPAAMTIAAMLLSTHFYALKPSNRLKYATLALLFVNVSVGGALTHFAAPPVVMVASKWGWGLSAVFNQFGYSAMATIVISNLGYFLFFRKELSKLGLVADTNANEKISLSVTALHFGFMAWTVWTLSEHQTLFMLGGLLLFVVCVKFTPQWQSPIQWRGPSMVGIFLAGLVVLGGLQSWWIAPVLVRLDASTLLLASTALTSFNDNAAVTYLASQVPALMQPGVVADGLRHAVMAGALAGGGLTVIANAPNPAGQSILGGHFEDGVSALQLAFWALFPTAVAVVCFLLI